MDAQDKNLATEKRRKPIGMSKYLEKQYPEEKIKKVIVDDCVVQHRYLNTEAFKQVFFNGRHFSPSWLK